MSSRPACLTLLALLAAAAAFGRSVGSDGPRGPHAPAARAALPAEPAPASRAVPDAPVEVRGRCVDAESGAPLAGCEVFAVRHSMAHEAWDSPFQSTLARMPGHAPRRVARIGALVVDDEHAFEPAGVALDITLDRHFLPADRLAALRGERAIYRSPNAVTEADGRFAVPLPAVGARLTWWQVEIAAPLRCPRTLEGFVPRPGEEHDLGDIPLHRGVRVQGRVHDERGAPLVHASLWLDGVPSRLPRETGSLCTQTFADGRFAFEEPVPAGRHPLRLRAAGARLLRPADVVVARAGVEVDVVVQRAPAISGVLKDPAGRPLAGTVLLAIGPGRVVCGKAISDESGRFCVRPDQTDPPPVRLVTGRRSRELAEPARPLAWGTANLELALRETRPLDLVVVDAVTGEGVDASLRVELTPLGPGTCTDLEENESFRRRDRHGGRLRIEHVRSGRHRIRVALRCSDRLVPVMLETDLARDARRSLLVLMPPALPLRVVVTADGAPLPGARVDMVRSGAVEGALPRGFDDEDFLSYAETHADGSAVITGAAAGMLVDLRAWRDGYEPAVVRALRMAENLPVVRLRLARAR